MIQRIEKGLVSVQKSGTILGFESRSDYDEWLKTPECKEASLLFAEPQGLLEHIREADSAQDDLETLKSWVNENVMFLMTLPKNIKDILVGD